MDQTTILIIAGSLAFTGIVFFIIIRSSKNKPMTFVSEVVEDAKNPGLYHVFGAVTFMPDDSPSFEKYQHFLLNTADLKVIKGLEQRGSEFDLRSPFAARCVEHMKSLSGRDLKLKEEEEFDDEEAEEAAEREREKSKIEIVTHDREESDTSIPKKIKGNVIHVYDTSYGDLHHFSLQLTLDGMTFSVPKVKGMGDLNKVIWRKDRQKLFLFYNRMVLLKFGVGLLVLDTNSGAVLSDDYFRPN